MSQSKGIPMQKIFHDASIGTIAAAAYTELDAALNANTRSADIFNSTGEVLILAVGPSGSESDFNFYVLLGGNGHINLMLNAGQRLAVKAASTDATTGELILNLYY